MYEKLVTFEEEKREEHLYVLFNGIFVCACLICVFEAIFNIPFLLTDSIGHARLKWIIEMMLRPLCSSLAVFFPFFIYNVRQGKPLKEKLGRQYNSAHYLYYIAGAVVVFFAVPFFVYLGDLFSSHLIGNGYVINEIYPDVGNTVFSNIVFTVYTSAVSAFILELAFRGIICEKLSNSHSILAIVIPSLISSLYTYSFIRIPYLFVTGLFISWCYLKTRSLYLSMFLNFISNVSFNMLCILKLHHSELYYTHIKLIAVSGIILSVAAFLSLIAICGIGVKYHEAKNEEESYERLSGKEAFSGVFKSFGFWIMLFIFVFQLFFTYLDKPTFDSENSNKDSELMSDSITAAE